MSRTTRRFGTALVVLALVLAAVAPPVLATVDEDDGAVPLDPPTDTLGWENGYWYNETIDVDQSDGLTAAELEAYISRAQARVEQIRRLEFTEDVPVTVVTRAEFVAESANGTGESGAYSAWNNQVWEALFTVNESANVSDEFAALNEGAILGYYDTEADAIVVVSDNPETVVLDNATLVHELVHALQDQQFDLNRSRFWRDTQDGQLAASGLIEGDASYVEERYVRNCGVNYSCVATPRGNATAGGLGGINVGLYVDVIQPYSDGPAFVADLYRRGGWAAVNAAYERVPDSTEQIIHSERYPDETAESVVVADTARNGWRTFAAAGVGGDGTDVVGEASVFGMFWYQGYRYGTPVVDVSQFVVPDDPPYDTYNYTSAPSEGWAGDRLLPYYRSANGAFDEETEYAYVWRTVWDEEADATQFHLAYLWTLAGHNATRVAENTYVIPDDPAGDGYGDAFYVEQDGRSVVVVNAPTAADLGDVKPEFDVPSDDGAENATVNTTG